MILSPVTIGNRDPFHTLRWRSFQFNTSDSSLSSALDEELTRPWPNERCITIFCDPLPPPSTGWMRIPQSCQVSPIYDIIYFRWKSQVRIPISSLLAGMRQINHCDHLLSSPAGFVSFMKISVSNLHITGSSSKSKFLIVGWTPLSSQLYCCKGEATPIHGPNPWLDYCRKHSTLHCCQQNSLALG